MDEKIETSKTQSQKEPVAQPIVNDPAQQKPSNHKKRNLLVLFILTIILIAGGTAYAIKLHQQELKDQAAAKAAAVKTAAIAASPINLISVKNDKDKSYSLRVQTLQGMSLGTHKYNEYLASTAKKPDGSAMLYASVDTTNKVHYRELTKNGKIREVSSSQLPKTKSPDIKSYPTVLGYVGSTGSFVVRQPVDDFNSNILAIDTKGSAKVLLSEDRLTYLSSEGLSPNGEKYLYEKITAKGESCGGTEEESGVKIPDYAGPMFELRSYDLKTGADTLLIKDARKPVPGAEAYAGLRVGMFAGDSTKAYMIHAGGGCGMGVRTVIYPVDLEKTTISKINVAPDYANSVDFDAQGKYALYTLLGESNDPTKILLLNLETGQQQTLTLPGATKDIGFPSYNGSAVVDGQEKMIISWNGPRGAGDSEPATQTVTLLNVADGTFDHTLQTPNMLYNDKPCYTPVGYVQDNNLYVSSGCGIAAINLKTNKVTAHKTDDTITDFLN